MKILAVTATATKETLDSVTCRLSMEKPVLIGLPPDTINIKYVVQPCPNLTEFYSQLTAELMLKQARTPKTVIYVVNSVNVKDALNSCSCIHYVYS